MNITDKFMIAATGVGSGLVTAGLTVAFGWGASGPHDMALPLFSLLAAPVFGLVTGVGGSVAAYRRLRNLHGCASIPRSL